MYLKSLEGREQKTVVVSKIARRARKKNTVVVPKIARRAGEKMLLYLKSTQIPLFFFWVLSRQNPDFAHTI